MANDYVDEMSSKLNKPIVYYHKFLKTYKNTSNDIHVFCEGNVDLNYYCSQIKIRFPDIKVNKWFVEGKKNVIDIWETIDWNLFTKKRVLFFVDRDLSYWVGEPQFYDSNVYITDEYSFENDAVSAKIFIETLEDFYGFANYLDEERECIIGFYERRWKDFKEGSYELMAYSLYVYETTHEHHNKPIKLQKCLSFNEDGVWKETIEYNRKEYSREEYYKLEFEIDADITASIRNNIERFTSDKEHYSIRGKWCLTFMISLMNYILKFGEKFAPSLYEDGTKRPKRVAELSSDAMLAMLGPRIVPPQSLICFINANLVS